MKRTIIIFFAVSITAAVAFAGKLPTDENRNPVQTHSPDGSKSQTLPASRKTIDMRGWLSWMQYNASADVKVRFMNNSSASTRASFKQSTLPSAQWNGRGVHPSYSFVNFSSSSASELEGM